MPFSRDPISPARPFKPALAASTTADGIFGMAAAARAREECDHPRATSARHEGLALARFVVRTNGQLPLTSITNGLMSANDGYAPSPLMSPFSGGQSGYVACHVA